MPPSGRGLDHEFAWHTLLRDALCVRLFTRHFRTARQKGQSVQVLVVGLRLVADRRPGSSSRHRCSRWLLQNTGQIHLGRLPSLTYAGSSVEAESNLVHEPRPDDDRGTPRVFAVSCGAHCKAPKAVRPSAAAREELLHPRATPSAIAGKREMAVGGHTYQMRRARSLTAR